MHVQKQTKIKMNDTDSPGLGAAPTQLPSCGGKLPPTAPPPPRLPAPASLGGLRTHQCRVFELGPVEVGGVTASLSLTVVPPHSGSSLRPGAENYGV